MYQIGICDDEAAERGYLAGLVEQWAEERGHQVRLWEFSSAENFLFCYEEHRDLHILLLDIEMGKMDGVTMAKTLRRDNDALQIIFVTGYSDYIAEGYEVAALHYLMKPVQPEKLLAVLDRAVEKLGKDERMFTFEASGELVRLPVRQIRFAQVQGNYVTLHAREEYTVKMTLADLVEGLDERFFRAGRSVVVNLTLVSRVTKTEIHLQDGTVLPLPRGAYEKINRAIIDLG
jgi:DNA-binding LytR/AlgR family response regulator